MFLGIDEPTFSLRWTEADGGLLIAVGTSHRVGEFKADPYDTLAAFVHARYAGAEEHYRWSAHDHHTADRVPFIGWYRASTYVATGFRAWGLSTAMVASKLLSDLITGKPNPWETLYDPIRLKLVTSAPRVAVQGLASAKHLLLDRLRVHGDIGSLNPGSATTFRQGGRFLGAYRDPSGEFHFVSLSCPHMGCIVQWNPHDETWDCPCHGSRFSAQGEVLYGPALHGISVSEVAPTVGATSE
jgi:nitrite reductase/ring-hydroxylating ferredoxin subunit